MTYQIRTATPRDAAGVLAVYAPYVEHTTVSFEFTVPSVDEYAARIAEALERRTFIVLEHIPSKRIVGFACHGPFGHRAAYQWSAETTIYLAESLTGCGLGAVLLEALERLMAAQGIVNAEACICSDNTGSIAFHERHGYSTRAEFPSCAHKFERWLGIVWMEKAIAEKPSQPVPLQPLDNEKASAILAEANARLEQLA